MVSLAEPVRRPRKESVRSRIVSDSVKREKTRDVTMPPRFLRTDRADSSIQIR